MAINIEEFISTHKKDKQLWLKLTEMMNYTITEANKQIADVQYKLTDSSKLSEEAIKEILKEQGFKYITDVMDTITGFEFNVMISFIDLINQLKGTRKGLELVLRLMGFDSIIKEWWEETLVDREPWSYEIIIIFDNSYVSDIYTTIDRVKEFSENYVIAKISNTDIKFLAFQFASRGAIMGGFSRQVFRGSILSRIN